MVTTNKNVRIKTYKDLIAWQKSYRLCLCIYKTAGTFPAPETYGLTSQIKRSALSIPSNIAEGYTRHQTNDYLRFLYIAYSSLAELETQLLLANDLKYLQSQTFSELTEQHHELQRIMYGLIKSLELIKTRKN